jgi:chromosome segregation ATPase
MVTDTLVWQMLGAFEVSRVCFNISFGTYPSFPLGSDFGFDRGQELKERSCRKSLFIRHESSVWAVLTRQRALVEEANKRLSKKSTEVDELRVVHAALREEAAQAREAMATAREDTTKAQEEATKAHEDPAPLLARVKDLEKDVALVSGQRAALNV